MSQVNKFQAALPSSGYQARRSLDSRRHRPHKTATASGARSERMLIAARQDWIASLMPDIDLLLDRKPIACWWHAPNLSATPNSELLTGLHISGSKASIPLSSAYLDAIRWRSLFVIGSR
jgi:hypothetical protein